jgi:hypothetical protein
MIDTTGMIPNEWLDTRVVFRHYVSGCQGVRPRPNRRQYTKSGGQSTLGFRKTEFSLHPWTARTISFLL